MRSGLRLPLILLLAPLLIGADKPVLVTDVSQSDIDIVYSFSGTERLLYGAILDPAGPRSETEAQTDIIVIVKGPSESILVREKQQVAGIWINVGSARYRSAPSFYAVASTRPIRSLVDDRTRAIYEFGLDSLQLSPISGGSTAEQARFAAGYVDLKRRSGLYYEAPGAVEITRDVLYRARIQIPARVPIGRYTAETFLIRGGRVVAADVSQINVRKSGFERFVARWAQHQSVLYGLCAVLLSLGLGWAAGALWRRF